MVPKKHADVLSRQYTLLFGSHSMHSVGVRFLTIPDKYTRRVLIASISLARKEQRLDDACGVAIACAVSAPENEVPPL